MGSFKKSNSIRVEVAAPSPWMLMALEAEESNLLLPGSLYSKRAKALRDLMGQARAL